MSKNALIGLIITLLAGSGIGGYKLIKDSRATAFEESIHPVARVIDGDTIEIEDNKKIRLLGIDAPERDTCYFTESRQALRDLLNDKDIRIEKDISGTDEYDRFLRYVFIPAEDPEEDEFFVNEWLVREGFAHTFARAPNNRYRDLFATAQQEARENERGLWSDACEYAKEYKSAQTLREQGSEPENPECTIKGNISEKGYGKLYFLEGCPNYMRIKVDERKGEAWFCSEEEARTAGFTRSESCDTTF